MTDELFREDAALDTCDARITILGEAGIELDRTVFYPQGSGQAGDRGEIRMADGRVLVIADTKKGATDGAIVHLPAPAPGQEALLATLSVDMPVRAAIDRTRRRRHMRFHTATRLLCALVPYPVNGCSITMDYARLDFHMTEPLDKEALNAGLARLVAEAHPVSHHWISDSELDATLASCAA